MGNYFLTDLYHVWPLPLPPVELPFVVVAAAAAAAAVAVVLGRLVAAAAVSGRLPPRDCLFGVGGGGGEVAVPHGLRDLEKKQELFKKAQIMLSDFINMRIRGTFFPPNNSSQFKKGHFKRNKMSLKRNHAILSYIPGPSWRKRRPRRSPLPPPG